MRKVEAQRTCTPYLHYKSENEVDYLSPTDSDLVSTLNWVAYQTTLLFFCPND